MILVPVIALVLGLILGGLLPPIGGQPGQYLAVACLAGFDTVCGGIRTGYEQKFRTDVFVTGFIVNVVIAFGLSMLGDYIGQNMFLVAALVFGQRIFNNLSIIRRQLLTKWQSDRERRKRAAEQAQAQAQAPAPAASQTQTNS